MENISNYVLTKTKKSTEILPNLIELESINPIHIWTSTHSPALLVGTSTYTYSFQFGPPPKPVTHQLSTNVFDRDVAHYRDIAHFWNVGI